MPTCVCSYIFVWVYEQKIDTLVRKTADKSVQNSSNIYSACFTKTCLVTLSIENALSQFRGSLETYNKQIFIQRYTYEYISVLADM